MKNTIVKKFFIIWLVLNILLISDSNFIKCSYAIYNEINENKSNTEMENVELNITQEISKNIDFDVGDTRGKLLQTKFTIEKNNNTDPVLETNIEIEVPKINNEKPEKVIINASTTQLSDGTNGDKFTSNNYTYNNEDGILKIIIKNENTENNIVALDENAKDEYIVNYIYDKGAMNAKEQEIQQKVKLTIKQKEENNTSLENTITYTIDEKQIGNLITSKINTDKENISKGYLYTKLQNTPYKEEIKQEIDYSEIIDKMQIELLADSYKKEDEESSTIAHSFYKTTQISEDNFNKILGQEGSIDIINNEEKIATINKDTEKDENGNFIINYKEGVNYLKFITSKPIESGTLEIQNTKEIGIEDKYTKDNITQFKKLEMGIKTSYYNKEKIIANEENKKQIMLEEPTTDAEVYIDKADFTTVSTNENVVMNVILKSNNNSYELYKNPTIEMIFPQYITEINIKESQLLLDEELKIKNIETGLTSDGNKTIKINITGEQTKYNVNDIADGAVIALKADIKTDKLTPSKEDYIKTYITNENATNYKENNSGKLYKETEINYIAPTGMVTVNKITSNNQSVMSLSNQQENLTVEAYSGQKQITSNIMIINNTNITATNIKILGRIPFENNKDIITNENLGSTFTANIISDIQAITEISKDNIEVYYSENGLASKELEKQDNEWQTMPTDFSNIKSYLIVLKNYEMKKGDILEFNYPIQIPSGLRQSQKTFGTYVMYYTPSTEEIQENKEIYAKATPIGIQTNEGPELETTITSDVTGENVQEGKIITYTVTVKNVGKIDATNVAVTGIIPDNTSYIYKNPINNNYIENTIKTKIIENVEKISVGETYEMNYQVKVNKIENGEGDIIEAYSIVNCDNLDKEIKSDSIYNERIINVLDIELVSNNTAKAVKEEKEITFTLTLANKSKVSKKVVPYIILPEGVKLLEAEEAEYDETNKKLYWQEIELKTTEQKTLTFKISTEKLNEEINEKNITFTAIAEVKYMQNEYDNSGNETTEEIESTVYSSKLNYIISKSNVNVELESDIEENEELKSGDTLTYTVKIKNEGKVEENSIYIKENIPSELEIINIEAEDGIIVGQVNNSVDMILQIKGNTTKQVTIKTKVKAIKEKRKEIINQLTYSISGEEKQSNSIKHIIVNENGKDTKETTYKISGTVWLDENKNGIKDSTEEKLSNIRVFLIDVNTGKLMQETNTNVSGKYVFNELTANTYAIVFLYENSEYSVTEYHKLGVEEKENSDAIETNVNLEGKVITAAITENLNIENSNLYNIDLGLIKKPEFDLKIEKLITSLTVQNNKGVQKQEYGEGTNYAKVDINPKYIKGTNIIVEYKIKVTNEGEVEGYAKSIVDYLPEELKFNSELNSNWYQNRYGTIYSLELADTVIKPQETKEIKLILTKTFTEETEMGKIKNEAEIYQDYNIYGIKDKDSTVANKNTKEDDYSSAELVLSVNTGRKILYIGIIICSILLLSGGIYLIKKKVINKKKEGEE